MSQRWALWLAGLVLFTGIVAGGTYAAWRHAHRAVVVAPEPPKELAPVPPELRELVKTMKLPYSENHLELYEAYDPPERVPNVLVNHEGIFLDGKRVGAVSEILTAGRLARVDELFLELQAWRDAWKAKRPGEDFPGIVQIWIDARTSALVVKSVFQTCAYAGFPNVCFVTLARDDRWHVVRINADARVPGPPKPEEVERRGWLPHDVVQQRVRATYPSVRACYERGLARNPGLTGKVEVRFVVGVEGGVQSAELTQRSTLGDADVRACVLEAFRKLVFPAPEGGTAVVVYPIELEPG
jgi:TonB family protein